MFFDSNRLLAKITAHALPRDSTWVGKVLWVLEEGTIHPSIHRTGPSSYVLLLLLYGNLFGFSTHKLLTYSYNEKRKTDKLTPWLLLLLLHRQIPRGGEGEEEGEGNRARVQKNVVVCLEHQDGKKGDPSFATETITFCNAILTRPDFLTKLTTVDISGRCIEALQFLNWLFRVISFL